MITNINSEERLVQKTVADHLRDVLGWERVYAFNDETIGPNGTLGRANEHEVVHACDLRAALKRLDTGIQHLCHFHEFGGTLDPERLLAVSRLLGPERNRVMSAFDRLGHQRLTPVYEALARAVPYRELHLLRLYRLLTLN